MYSSAEVFTEENTTKHRGYTLGCSKIHPRIYIKLMLFTQTLNGRVVFRQ
jgi:hypothetical protein